MESNRLSAWIDLEDLAPIDVPALTRVALGQEPPVTKIVSPVRGGDAILPSPQHWRRRPASLVLTLFVDCVRVDEVQRVILERCVDLTMLYARQLTRGVGKALTCRGLFQVEVPVQGREQADFSVGWDGATISEFSFATSPMMSVAEQFRAHRNITIREALDRARQQAKAQQLEFEHAARNEGGASVTDLVHELVATIDRNSPLRSSDREHRLVRRAEQLGKNDQPAITHLASFYRKDLDHALSAGPTDSAATPFISSNPDRGVRLRRASVDVGKPATALSLVGLDKIPAAAWPSKHRLALSQQVAVRAASDTGVGQITAVNGPPGTGKSTILRELYAHAVTERAEKMCEFDNPVDAFTDKRWIVVDHADGKSHQGAWWTLDARLVGYEMLVAGTSNNAVENVSRSIPNVKATEGFPNIAYFSDAANFDVGSAEEGLERDDVAVPASHLRDQWGLAAMALGNQKNVRAVLEQIGVFSGAKKPFDGAGNQHLLSTLRGRDPTESLQTWRAARSRFSDARRKLESVREELRDAALAEDELPVAEQHDHELRAQLDLCSQHLAVSTKAVEQAEQQSVIVETRVASLRLETDQLDALRPSWWEFFTRHAKTWRKQRMELLEARVDTGHDQQVAKAHLDATQHDHNEVSQRHASIQHERDHSAAILSELAKRAEKLGDVRPRSEWFEPETAHGYAQRTAWVDDRLHECQHETFAAAMAVHEAFLTAAGPQVRANLLCWSNLLLGQIEADKQLVATGWQTLFLTVPMVSTTFASAAKLLRHIQDPIIGWAIIDEAGQARPAEAIGVLRRSQRSVIVGDPAQLEPVVTTPDEIIQEVMSEHDVDVSARIRSLSVQDFADGCSTAGSVRNGEWIGAPLLVHHRCLDPMFSISNSLSYGGAMVQGRHRGDGFDEGPDYDAAGPSRWIDVVNSGDGHFNPSDVDAVLDILRCFEPNDWAAELTVGVVSPFRDVVAGLHRRLGAHRRELDLPGTEEEIKRRLNWATVHTYQGQERDVMIVVLGGGTHGARQWASMPPNLLNVAVTRAKDRLYVVGDADRWLIEPNAAELYRLLV